MKAFKVTVVFTKLRQYIVTNNDRIILIEVIG